MHEPRERVAPHRSCRDGSGQQPFGAARARDLHVSSTHRRVARGGSQQRLGVAHNKAINGDGLIEHDLGDATGNPCGDLHNIGRGVRVWGD